MSTFHEDLFKSGFLHDLEEIKKDLKKLKDEYGLKDSELPDDVKQVKNNARKEKANKDIQECKKEIKEYEYNNELLESKLELEKESNTQESNKIKEEALKEIDKIIKEKEINDKKHKIALLKLQNEETQIKKEEDRKNNVNLMSIIDNKKKNDLNIELTQSEEALEIARLKKDLEIAKKDISVEIKKRVIEQSKLEQLAKKQTPSYYKGLEAKIKEEIDFIGKHAEASKTTIILLWGLSILSVVVTGLYLFAISKMELTLFFGVVSFVWLFFISVVLSIMRKIYQKNQQKQEYYEEILKSLYERHCKIIENIYDE